VAGVNRDCDALAVDVRQLTDNQASLNAGLLQYAQAHPDVELAVRNKLQPTVDRFFKAAEPTFVHCKGNKAFLEAITRPHAP
jgi:hypothetical protein